MWNQDAARATRPALGVPRAPPLPAAVDVVVVGAGVAGVSAAFELCVRRGKRVVVLEGRCVGAGQRWVVGRFGRDFVGGWG